jgi:O-antigen ligase
MKAGASVPETMRPMRPLNMLAIIFAGALLAFSLHRLWSLEKTSHFALLTLALGSLGISALFLRRFQDYLWVVFVFCVPITGLFKTFFLLTAGYDDRNTAILLTSGVVGIGPVDVALALLYANWIFQIFVTRRSQLPTWELPDLLVVMLMAAYVISTLNAPEPRAAWFATLYQTRFVLTYLYVSRNLQWRHLGMALAALCVIAYFEFALASYQAMTGKLTSLILDRGAGVNLSSQYVVPGIEQRHRATGTCNESHGFGLFMAITAQWLAVGMFHQGLSRLLRLAAALAFCCVLVGLLLSYSRSAWLAGIIALLIVWGVHLIWGERQVIPTTILAMLFGMAMFPWALSLVVERFATSEGLLAARFEQYPIAWSIWKDHFLFGYGAGNYMWALETYNRQGALELPVHNVFLWIGAEMGLVGVIAYFGLVGLVMVRAVRHMRTFPSGTARVGLAVLGSLMASLLDGLTDPLYREPVVYMLFWIALGVGTALRRLERTQANSGSEFLGSGAAV